VVVAPNLIGDAVMATPCLRTVRQTWPSARITVVAKPQVAPVFDGAPWFDHRILFAPRAARSEHRMMRAVLALRKERAELAILLPNSFRSALLAWMSGIPRRLGYARGGRAGLLTERLQPRRNAGGGFLPVPAVEYYLALARQVGAFPTSARTELFTTPDDEAAADAAWGRLGLPSHRAVIVLNTGGAFGPAKNWPVGHFVTLAQQLAHLRGTHVLVLCGPAERDTARAIAARSNHPRVVSLANGPLSIGLSKACVRRAALLITTDSGPRHFAGAFGTPVITLFGPTHIGWTRTYHPNAIHLQQPVPCGPCQQPVCPERHHRCMVELTPEAVLEAAARLLGPVLAQTG
jgi:heptosyltransferase-2